MRLPHRTTPIARCEVLSLYTQGALRTYPTVIETAPDVPARLESLAQSLEAATSALLTAQAEYRNAVLALIPLRFGVRLIDLKADNIVRSVKRAAEDAGKDVAAAIFPNGTTPIVRPVGSTQVDALRALEGRVAAASRWATRNEHLDRLVAVRTEYEELLGRRREAMITAAAKRAERNAAKDDFLDVFAAIAGAIREVFPRDRKRQDLFFDSVSSRSNRSDSSEADDAGDTDDAADE